MTTNALTKEQAWELHYADNAVCIAPGAVDLAMESFFAGWIAAKPDLPKGAVGWWAAPTEQPEEITAEDIYMAYPRKTARLLALKAITKAMKSVSWRLLLESTKAYAAAVAKWPPEDRERFTPHPATWFNRGSYDDDPQTWIRHSQIPNGRIGHLAIKARE